MFLENTCICDGKICPEVLFTFTPPSIRTDNSISATNGYGIKKRGFGAYDEVSSIDYLSAWEFTNAAHLANPAVSHRKCYSFNTQSECQAKQINVPLKLYQNWSSSGYDYRSLGERAGNLSCICDQYQQSSPGKWLVECSGSSSKNRSNSYTISANESLPGLNATQAPPNNNYLGCYTDDSDRDFCCGPKVYGFNHETCAAACATFKYFALQNNGYCSCDNDFSTPSSTYTKMPDSDCGPKKLGGSWRNAVHSNESPATSSGAGLLELINLGNSGCSSSKQCSACEGDCDSDGDCTTGLQCFQRDSSDQMVPGCSKGSQGDIGTHDYCYEQASHESNNLIPVADYGSDGRSNMTECEGDCDSDRDCSGDLTCFQRGTDSDVVPGCATTGYVTTSTPHDYCYKKSDSDSSCISWRQTSDCDPNGNREPENDLPCNNVIRGSSGYCECEAGRKEELSTCDHEPFTCQKICTGSNPIDEIDTAAEEEEEEEECTRSNGCQNLHCRGNLPTVLMILHPADGLGRKEISDTHCWANSLGPNYGTYGRVPRHRYRQGFEFEGNSMIDVLELDSNRDFYRFGQQSSDVPYSGLTLIAYASLLGLFVVVQEILNFSPDGHKCSKWIVKDIFCINLFRLCLPKQIMSTLCGEFLYYLVFVAGYNVILSMFLSPGQDLTGYDKDTVNAPEYQGAGLWVASVDETLSTVLSNVACSFVLCMFCNAVCLIVLPFVYRRIAWMKDTASHEIVQDTDQEEKQKILAAKKQKELEENMTHKASCAVRNQLHQEKIKAMKLPFFGHFQDEKDVDFILGDELERNAAAIQAMDSSIPLCGNNNHWADPLDIMFYRTTFSDNHISFQCVYCDEQFPDIQTLQLHWKRRQITCTWSKQTSHQYEPQLRNSYKIDSCVSCVTAKKQCCLASMILLILLAVGIVLILLLLGTSSGAVTIVAVLAIYAPFIVPALYYKVPSCLSIVLLLLQLISALTFVIFYIAMVVQMIIMQVRNIDFEGLLFLAMPTLNFGFINISFPMMITVTFSMSLGISRIASMCFKGCSSFGKRTKGMLKKVASQRHMLTESEGKTNIKKAASESVQEVATEKAKEKLIEEADRRLEEAEEARTEKETTASAEQSKDTTRNVENRTKVFPTMKEEDEDDEEDEEDEDEDEDEKEDKSLTLLSHALSAANEI